MNKKKSIVYENPPYYRLIHAYSDCYHYIPTVITGVIVTEYVMEQMNLKNNFFTLT